MFQGWTVVPTNSILVRKAQSDIGDVHFLLPSTPQRYRIASYQPHMCPVQVKQPPKGIALQWPSG
jgi:hypothetical protein